MKSSGLITGVLLLAGAVPTAAVAQGCVVSRGSGMSPLHSMICDCEEPGVDRLQFASGYRYLHSARHFVGSEEQTHRREEGSQVVNDSHFIDLAFTYAFNKRTSLTVTVPYASHDRSSVVRDSNRAILRRYHTQNSGLGDLRIMSNTWLFDAEQHQAGNVLLGVGIDAPTGEDGATDLFDTYDTISQRIVKTRRTVDQSVQLGDGGWAALVDIYAFRRFASKLAVSFSGSYAITPEETNGVVTN